MSNPTPMMGPESFALLAASTNFNQRNQKVKKPATGMTVKKNYKRLAPFSRRYKIFHTNFTSIYFNVNVVSITQ